MEASPKFFLIDPILSTVGLKERFTDDNADVVFTSGSDKTFSAHRAVLSVSSSVFFKMFEGEWKEKNTKEISLPDTVDFEAFSAALSLLYGIQVSVEKGRLLEVYKLADMYDLASVKMAIAMGIPGWNTDLVIDMCLLATQFDSQCLCNAKIMQSCVDFFISNFHTLSNEVEVEISKLPYEVMMKVVQSDELNVSSELEVSQVLVKWTRSQSNISFQQVQDLFEHVRYDAIPYKQLSTVVSRDICNHERFGKALASADFLDVESLQSEIKWFAPRKYQTISHPLKVYPLHPDIVVTREAKCSTFTNFQGSNYKDNPSQLGIIYFGDQEKTIRITAPRADEESDSINLFEQLQLTLQSVNSLNGGKVSADQMLTGKTFRLDCNSIQVRFKEVIILFTPKGVRVSERSRKIYPEGKGNDFHYNMTGDLWLPFNEPLPWIAKLFVPYDNVLCGSRLQALAIQCE